MKANLHSTLAVVTVFASVLGASDLTATQTNTTPSRIGIYDSRAVAYAWFTSSANMRELHKQIQEAKDARTCGDTKRFHKLRTMLRQMQDQIYREVFSTAPPNEALAQIKNRLPAIENTAGVTALVSKWDDAALKKYPGAERVDVTDRLAREFNPTERQLKMISSIEKNKPLSLFWCNILIRIGAL